MVSLQQTKTNFSVKALRILNICDYRTSGVDTASALKLVLELFPEAKTANYIFIREPYAESLQDCVYARQHCCLLDHFPKLETIAVDTHIAEQTTGFAWNAYWQTILSVSALRRVQNLCIQTRDAFELTEELLGQLWPLLQGPLREQPRVVYIPRCKLVEPVLNRMRERKQ